MGWSRGSMLAKDIWLAVEPYIPQIQQQRVARMIWASFEDYDCDTLDEAMDFAQVCGYDYYETYEDDLTCGKWDCTATAQYMGDVCGLRVQVCHAHLTDVTNPMLFPED